MVDRKANIDLLRVISAAAIVILHSVTAPMGNASSPIPLLTEQILTVIHSLTLWAVPAFFICWQFVHLHFPLPLHICLEKFRLSRNCFNCCCHRQ